MKESRVALVHCDSYDEEKVYEAVKTGMGLLGGFGAFIKPEESILLKPNLLLRASPEKAVTTHPAVLGAVGRCLREEGFDRLSYGDSPGSPTTTPLKAAEAAQLTDPAAKWGLEAADFETVQPVSFPEGNVSKSFLLAKAVAEADALISLSKMKTHALERITGAMKNLYGCIVGANKAAGHVRHPNSYVFADMLADLHRCVKPRLHIMDGILAMEGNGPSSGVPRAMNLLLFSDDPVALDAVFAALIDLDAAEVPTCVSGEKAGLGTMQSECIRVLTPDGELTAAEAAEKYGCRDFDVYRGSLKRNTLSRLALLLPFLQERPAVDETKCIGCGVCEKACPVPGKAVHSGHGKKAVYNYKKCIHCFCCQEMCPEKAIYVHRSAVNRLLTRGTGKQD